MLNRPRINFTILSTFSLTLSLVVSLAATTACTKFETMGSTNSGGPEKVVPQGPKEGPAVAPVVKSNRQQEALVLPNGLEVLLVSSPAYTKASAAVAVPVGSWHDPEEHEGLAHFLEHMLFLGTKEYPNPEEYGEFVKQNGGYTNAYTAKGHTNYHFEVVPAAMGEALHRFSRFFVSPTLDPKYADKERNAVNSEFDKNIQNDGWRIWGRMIGMLEAEKHPGRKFNIGSKKTLANASSKVLRDFYEAHYSSDTMKLVVQGNQPLSDLRALAIKNFSDVPNRQLRPRLKLMELEKTPTGQAMEVKTIANGESLLLGFPNAGFAKYWRTKPHALVGALLNYAGEGSLSSALKRQQLVTGFSVYADDPAPEAADKGVMYVNLDLTKKGVEKRDEIVKTVFAYLGQLQRDGVKKYIFSEAQTMARLGLENRGLADGAAESSRLVALMLQYPAMELDERSNLLFNEDLASADQLLKTLNPDNVNILFQSPNLKPKQLEAPYGIQYDLEPISQATKDSWKQAMATAPSAYQYRPVNPWTPKSFQLFKNENQSVPNYLVNEAAGSIWFLQESGPETKPMAHAIVRVWSPETAKNARNDVLAQIYKSAFEVSQVERLALPGEAGYGTALTVSGNAIQITLSGYSEKFPEVLKDIVASKTSPLNKLTISEDDLVKIKGQLKQQIDDHQLKSAIDRVQAQERYLLNGPDYLAEELERELGSITLKEFENYQAELFRRVYVDGLIYGNVKRDAVADLLPAIVSSLGAGALKSEEVEALQTEALLQPGQKFASQISGVDNNNAMWIRVTGGPRTNERAAATLVLGGLMSSAYYAELRTNQQLGYIVHAGSSNSARGSHLLFIVQSAGYEPEVLLQSTKAFWSDYLGTIDQKVDTGFDAVRTGLIASLSNKSTVMSERFAKLTNLFTSRDADWAYEDNLVAALKGLKKEDIKSLAVQMLTPETQTKLSVTYYGNGKPVPATAVEGEVLVKDKADFDQKRSAVK